MKGEKKHNWVKFYVSASAAVIVNLLDKKEVIEAQFNKIRFPVTSFRKYSRTSLSFKVLDPEMSSRFSAKIESILMQQLSQNMRAETKDMAIGNQPFPDRPVREIKRLTNIGMMGRNMLSEDDAKALFKD